MQAPLLLSCLINIKHLTAHVDLVNYGVDFNKTLQVRERVREQKIAYSIKTQSWEKVKVFTIPCLFVWDDYQLNARMKL